jgi:TorA maturation chaperone TorD
MNETAMQSRGDETTNPAAASATGEVGELRAAAALYRLLGRLLEEEIDAPLLGLLRGELREPLAAVGIHLPETVGEPVEIVLETLAEEYTGLFVAPGCISPYASVFETGTLFKEPCDRAVAAYREAGWDYRLRVSGEFPDHIGTMLAFMALLADAEAEALDEGDGERAARQRERRQRFLLQQLGPWGPGWCQRAAAAAFNPLYRSIIEATEQLLWSELALVAGRRQLRELAELNRRETPKLDYDADFRKASGL